MDCASIITLLRPVLSLSNHAHITKLPSGEINHVFKLSDNDKHYAAKWIGQDKFSGIDRFHQFGVQQQLADKGLAPKPLYLSDDGRLWIEQWVDTPSSQPDDPLDCLAQVLTKIHAAPITSRPLDLEQRWRHYIEAAGLRDDSELVARSHEMMKTVRQAARNTADIVFCHNDLSFGHVVDRNRHIVVDWEYSAMGSRYFDLASCSLINLLSDTQTQRLCEYYSEHTRIDSGMVYENVCQHLDVVKVTNALWYQALLASESEKHAPPKMK